VSVDVKPTGIGIEWRRVGLNRQRSLCQEDDEDGAQRPAQPTQQSPAPLLIHQRPKPGRFSYRGVLAIARLGGCGAQLLDPLSALSARASA
jgi:hypothetical protein